MLLDASSINGQNVFRSAESRGLRIFLEAGDQPVFPPIIATHLVKLACELPDNVGRSLSTWTCAELARTLIRDSLVDSISIQSVQRILESHRLKPWRVHHWLSSKVPRDQAFRDLVLNLSDLYTREPVAHERILSLDEKTSLQPRTRTSATKPALPDLCPVQLEHEYERKGALNLLAAFDIQSGEVIGVTRKRKRQKELIELLEEIDRRTPETVTMIHIVCDNVRMHKGKLVRKWLKQHPRFQMHFTPVHCSWMNQIEQWFSILTRKRLTAPNFADLDDLATKIAAFIDEWNQIAHPFDWSTKSFEKILAKVDAEIKQAA